MDNFTIDQEKVLLDALELYVEDLERQRQHLRYNRCNGKQDLLNRLNIANDLIISLPVAKAVTKC